MAIRGKKEQCKIFIDDLPQDTTKKDLKDYFQKFGTIQDVFLKKGFRDNVFNGFAFVLFNNSESIGSIFVRDEHYIKDKKVRVKMTLEYIKNRQIIIRGLTKEINDESIKEYFSEFGVIVNYSAPRDPKAKGRGSVCFIAFFSKDSIEAVLKIPIHEIDGKIVDVERADPNLSNREQVANLN